MIYFSYVNNLGWSVLGIVPFNSDIFTDTDFMVAELSGENLVQNDEETAHDNQRLITFDDPPGAKSNRGRKSMESAILTSPEKVSDLRERAKKRKQNADKKAAKKAKQKKPVKSKPSSPQKKVAPSKKTNEASSSSYPSEKDFCIICLQPMPNKLTKNNSIACNTCKRDVHLKCANIKNSYFTCVHCDSEFSEEEDA